MIPCRSTCPHYEEGCHKTCAYWKEYQKKAKQEQHEKMLWLKAQNERSSTVLRQCLAISSNRSNYYY